MIRILIILILFSCKIYGQAVTKVASAEYYTIWLTDNNKANGITWNGSANVWTDFGLNAIDADGAQYDVIVLVSGGSVRRVRKDGGGGPLVDNTWTTDTAGNPFTGVSKVFGWYQTYFGIRNDSLYYWGYDGQPDNGFYGSLRLSGTNGYRINRPMKLGQPTGRVIVDFFGSDESTRFVQVRCSDGSVWKYTQGSATPVQVSGLSNVTHIGGISTCATVVATATDILTYGQHTSVFGLSNNITTPTSILSSLTAVGLVMPIKELGKNSNILQIIDANDNLFVWGDSPHGEAGIGVELPNLRVYDPPGGNPADHTIFPFSWDFTRNQRLVGPVQVRGKYKNISNGSCIVFYNHIQDLHNQWYSWGRNKVYALGNGQRRNNDDTYPLWGNKPSMQEVDVPNQSWGAEPNFNPNDSLAPVANASAFNIDVTADTVTVFGDYSSQQEHGIASYAWTKVSGTGGTITSPSSMNTQITGLSTGTYVFRLTVTNTDGQTDTDDITIYVTYTPPSSGLPKMRRGGRITVL